MARIGRILTDLTSCQRSLYIDLAQHRQIYNIPPDHWWWYLDVLAKLPAGTRADAATPVPASARIPIRWLYPIRS